MIRRHAERNVFRHGEDAGGFFGFFARTGAPPPAPPRSFLAERGDKHPRGRIEPRTVILRACPGLPSARTDAGWPEESCRRMRPGPPRKPYGLACATRVALTGGRLCLGAIHRPASQPRRRATSGSVPLPRPALVASQARFFGPATSVARVGVVRSGLRMTGGCGRCRTAGDCVAARRNRSTTGSRPKEPVIQRACPAVPFARTDAGWPEESCRRMRPSPPRKPHRTRLHHPRRPHGRPPFGFVAIHRRASQPRRGATSGSVPLPRPGVVASQARFFGPAASCARVGVVRSGLRMTGGCGRCRTRTCHSEGLPRAAVRPHRSRLARRILPTNAPCPPRKPYGARLRHPRRPHGRPPSPRRHPPARVAAAAEGYVGLRAAAAPGPRGDSAGAVRRSPLNSAIRWARRPPRRRRGGRGCGRLAWQGRASRRRAWRAGRSCRPPPPAPPRPR
jgi:hypothetical protein